MRVVLDTNVLVSAALKDGSLPAQAVLLAERNGTVLKSLPTEQQLFAVLARPYLARLIAPAALGWMRRLMAAAEMVTITEQVIACRDPTDDRFLELALSGRADFVVSGDADLLVLQSFRGIPILPPAAFVQGVGRQASSGERATLRRQDDASNDDS